MKTPYYDLGFNLNNIFNNLNNRINIGNTNDFISDQLNGNEINFDVSKIIAQFNFYSNLMQLQGGITQGQNNQNLILQSILLAKNNFMSNNNNFNNLNNLSNLNLQRNNQFGNEINYNFNYPQGNLGIIQQNFVNNLIQNQRINKQNIFNNLPEFISYSNFSNNFNINTKNLNFENKPNIIDNIALNNKVIFNDHINVNQNHLTGNLYFNN